MPVRNLQLGNIVRRLRRSHKHIYKPNFFLMTFVQWPWSGWRFVFSLNLKATWNFSCPRLFGSLLLLLPDLYKKTPTHLFVIFTLKPVFRVPGGHCFKRLLEKSCTPKYQQEMLLLLDFLVQLCSPNSAHYKNVVKSMMIWMKISVTNRCQRPNRYGTWDSR